MTERMHHHDHKPTSTATLAISNEGPSPIQRWWQRNKRGIVPYLFLSPFLLIYATFMLYPVIDAFRLSFYQAGGFSEPAYVGLDNYRQLFDDDRFIDALRNTTVYTLAIIALQVPFALFIAMTVRSHIVPWNFLKSFYRIAFFVPFVTSSVVIALMFSLVFDKDFGLLNAGLTSIGLPSYNWLRSTDLALPAIIMTNIWAHFGIMSLYFLAGLQSIPEDIHEAAAIDGASGWQKFWSITLPLLRPITLFVVVQATIFSYQLFELPYLLTGGGPSDSTLTLAMYLYDVGFQQFERGYASAIGYTMVLIAMGIAAAQLLLYRWTNR